MSKSDCVNKTEESASSTRWLATGKRNDIWTSTNYNEERQRIREFWLQLSEVDRRSLVKVEKEAVLRKMKEQQRHSCNCSVCGKKRNAIEEELEVLYDTYYEELEQYAYRQQHKYTTVIQCKKKSNRTIEQEDSLKLLEFKNTLTVKGSIITVADDLLKNDGKKFLDMMERLAERKLIKERQVLSNSDDDEEEEESEKDKEESKQDNEDEEEDCVTEEQRMEEGRKMFQVFAARMFEQRVLTAYREKVAQDRQQRLIEELEEEDRQRREREQRKQQEKEKKRDKKRQLKAQQEKERLEIENKKKQEELAAKADRENKLKMERQIKEQERLKREEERLQKERDRLRKEDEKRKRRLKEEQDKEKKRLEEEQRQQKLKEDEERKKKETVQVIQAATSNAATAAVSAIQHYDEAVAVSSPKSNYQGHHILTDANTVVTPRGHHRTASAGPIGSPVHVSTLEPCPTYIVTNESESPYSFFSNFLFDQPTTRRDHQESRNKNSRRVSSDGSSSRRWSNGWTPLTTLSDNVHGKLFGDVLTTDRNTLLLERAKYAYLKLDELAQTQYFMIPHFHTLDQLHHMMRDLFYDISIETRELYDILTHHATEFKCYYNQHQQCYLVQYGHSPSRSNSSSLLPTSMISPLPSFTQLPTFSNS